MSTGAIDWNQPRHLVKISPDRVFYVIAHPDGALTERALTDWPTTWDGTWTVDPDGTLTLDVAGYRLRTDGPTTTATETSTADPDGPGTAFRVLPVASPNAWWLRSGDWVTALLKQAGTRNTFAAHLRPDGHVREYDVRDGWLSGTWGGTWVSDPSSGTELAVDVGGWRWAGSRLRGTGYLPGHETHDGATVAMPAVLIEVPLAGTRDPLPGRDPAAGTEPLFQHAGYTFHQPGPRARGYYADLLTATKPSLTGGDRRYAAKVVPASHAAVTRTETAITEQVSGTDGLIVAVDSFALPDRDDLAPYAGAHVQILEWCDTDLHRYTRTVGPLPTGDLLALTADIASALDALHRKFRLVHNDVRAANIVARRTGATLSWRLTDFNAATRLDPDGTGPYQPGTPICVPPNQPREPARVSPADDVWALGVTVLQAALGSTWPLDQQVPADAAADAVAALPDPVRDVIAPAVNLDPAQRASAWDVRVAADRARGT